jgi:hypothetical protein
VEQNVVFCLPDGPGPHSGPMLSKEP